MKNIFQSLLKVLYIMPAIFWCGIYVFVLILIDFDFRILATLSWIYPVLLLAAAILLLKEKWWGSALGILVGVLISEGNFTDMSIAEQFHFLYFTTIGILCYCTARGKVRADF